MNGRFRRWSHRRRRATPDTLDTLESQLLCMQDGGGR